MDCEFYTVGLQIPRIEFQSFSVELGFWIPIVSRVPDSLNPIPDSIAQDSRFRKQKFHSFWNTEFPYMGQEYITLFPIFLKRSLILASHQLNSLNHGSVLIFTTMFKHWNCFLSSVPTDGKDGYGLKLEKIEPHFSSFILIGFAWKNHQSNYYG